MKFHWVFIHLVCFGGFLFQLSDVFIEFLNPTTTNTAESDRKLRETDFPLIFKICVIPGFNKSAIQEAGYKGLNDYFGGRSKYNESVFGWGGHSDSLRTLASPQEILDKVSLHTVGSVIQRIQIRNSGKLLKDIDTDAILLRGVNYPNNCFTLDFLDVTEDINELRIKFQDRTFSSWTNSHVELHPQGANVATNRDLVAHVMYASGDKLKPEQGKTKKYIMEIKQQMYFEKEKLNNCKIYPNYQFDSYR